MNTATYRRMAVTAESECRWRDAAQCWRKAIEKYPTAGNLAKADIAKMAERAKSCEATQRDEDERFDRALWG